MDPTTPASSERDAIHRDQTSRVSDSLMHGAGHDVYHRRRLLGGTSACAIREAVKVAVLDSLAHTNRTYQDAAEAGALAADRALAQVGIVVEPANTELRDRLLGVERLLDRALDGPVLAARRSSIEAALAEIGQMVAGLS